MGSQRRAGLASTDDTWMGHGACNGLAADLFFPERGASTAEAKDVCAACPVRARCLEFALANRIKHGVWAGTTERERRRLRAARERDAS